MLFSKGSFFLLSLPNNPGIVFNNPYLIAPTVNVMNQNTFVFIFICRFERKVFLCKKMYFEANKTLLFPLRNIVNCALNIFANKHN